ncbi:hypothetical protein [Rhizosphaericola mali]|uniref:Uncharacterized protein n=1 Tax=Rhizosphaericola mali TaxID=2545455 RepID=A0A5P2GB98_9BACT|nr:hypothetical protein [Rhizosphaericola mali]QES88831.1 hypothetical protein E0W69_009255 [Rhizosphaericola mali]
MAKIELTGHIAETGEVKIWGRPRYDMWLKQYAGKDIKIMTETISNKRTTPQNAYYWSVVVPLVKSAINEFGNQYSSDDTHEFLKAQFNSEQVEVGSGLYIDMPQSTSKLDTKEFMEYILKIQQFSAEVFGLVIPDPQTNFINQ